MNHLKSLATMLDAQEIRVNELALASDERSFATSRADGAAGGQGRP